MSSVLGIPDFMVQLPDLALVHTTRDQAIDFLVTWGVERDFADDAADAAGLD